MSLGERPRSAADSVRFAVSPPNCWAVKDGTLWPNCWRRSVEPVPWLKASVPRTVMGAAESAAVIPCTRVPVTITVSAALP